jgi:hypothetical protein
MADQTVRKRACDNCGNVWYTVEVTVPSYAVGWSARHSRKPVLRVPIDVTVGHTRMRASHEEASDQLAPLLEANAATVGGSRRTSQIMTSPLA